MVGRLGVIARVSALLIGLSWIASAAASPAIPALAAPDEGDEARPTVEDAPGSPEPPAGEELRPDDAPLRRDPARFYKKPPRSRKPKTRMYA